MRKSRVQIFAIAIILSIFSLPLQILNALQEDQDLPFDNPDILISMDLQDASLKDILKILSVQSGLNFISSEGVQERKMTLYFDKVPLKQAMDKLFKANNLSYELEKDSNVFIVKDWGKPEVELETRVFYLKYASVSSSHIMEQVSANLSSSSSSAEGSESSGSSTSSSSTSSIGSSSTGSGDRYAVSSDIGITTAIKKLLSKSGSIIEDYRTNSLIVQDIPSRMPIIAETLAKLDVSMPQVLIEVEVLDCNKNDTDKLGMSYGETPISLALAGPILTGGFANMPLAPFLNKIGASATGKSYTPGTADFSGNGYSIALDFLRTQSTTRTLARPRILTLNNENAQFEITSNEVLGLRSDVVAGTGSSLEAINAQTGETGIRVTVTPQINMDTGEITMFIMPDVTDTSASSIPVNGEDFKDTFTRKTKSIVRIRDGETIVLGGLIQALKKVTNTKLPFFGDLPVLGALFRHKTTSADSERELLIFITPHIVKDKKVELAKTANLSAGSLPQIPLREQETVSLLDRQAVISSSLNKFQGK